jgi:type I restriction enzyme, S subunit
MKAPADGKAVAIGRFVELLNGFAFPSDGFVNGEGMPLIRIRDLGRGETEVNFRGKFSERYVVRRGDLLIGMDGDFSTVRWKGNDALLNQRVCKLVSKDPERLVQKFLFYRISGEIANIHRITAATTVKHLSSTDVLAIEIPLPSKCEQTKIAEILSTVDRAIEQAELLIAKQQRIKTGLMQDLLTRGIDEHGNLRSEQSHSFKDSPLGRIPVEWRVGVLGEVVGPIVSGWSPTCESVPASPGEWAILKTTAVVWPGYDFRENKRLPAHLRGVPSIEVHADDILITRKGPVERVGVVVHIDRTRSQLMIPDTVFRTRVVDEGRIVPAFLPLALGSRAVQTDWFQKKIGLADAQVNINHSILRATLFPEPSLDEQNVIVRHAVQLSQLLKCDLGNLEKLRRFKQALMQDLLTGKKRVTPRLGPELAN